MERLIDPEKCREVTDKHPDYFTFDVEEWLADPRNCCLREGRNLTFGEYKSPGVYWVHFCYDEARGRKAIELTKKMLDMFYSLMPVQVSIGLINEDNKKARWLIRQVGFTSLGMQETPHAELCEMFYWVNKDKLNK